jgi:glycosyltransferase involved in cell wall biosynthesis
MTKVVILRSNSTINDIRVKKIFNSLSKRYSLVVIGWNRELLSKDVISNNANVKLLNLKAPFGKISLIIYYPFFWSWVFFNLLKYRPKIIHACDLDTIPPAYLYKIFFRNKLIFDVFDRYAMSYIDPKLSLLYSLINSLEGFYAHRSDVLITVGKKLLESFKKKPKICSIIMNCPENTILETKVQNKLLKLVYTGNIVHERGLKSITKAVKDLDGVEFAFAGRYHNKEFLEEILISKNIQYLGLLSANESLKLEGQGDVIIVLYDLNIPINNFAMPNKIFIAMLFGIPTITNLAKEIIEENNCGLLVDYNNIDQIKEAIIKLRNNEELRKKMGINGRKAFIEKYNWNIMEKELFKTYDTLLNP